MSRPREIRDPIHGFIKLDEWEWDLINQPAFQRLRRIKQLAWTDYLYPGATHSRFEHSIGVMHVADRLFDAICRNPRNEEILKSDFSYTKDGLARFKHVVKLAALLHDIGHGPFSHAAEELFPINLTTHKKYSHEQYSSEIVTHELKDVIENHPFNLANFAIKVDHIKDFFLAKPSSGKTLVWRLLVSGQMDADRMDYLLRDSHYTGVTYGRYDLDRVIATVTLCKDPESEEYLIGVDQSGLHAIEGLLLARYMMFTQVYYHKTRVIYDHHLAECLKEILKDSNGTFPPPDSPQSIKDYLAWDDWKVLGAIANEKGGPHGKILHDRKHFRRIHETREVPDEKELERLEAMSQALKDYGVVRLDAEKSWYKFQNEEILVKERSGGLLERATPLSALSPVISGLKTVRQTRLYVPEEKKSAALKIVAGLPNA